VNLFDFLKEINQVGFYKEYFYKMNSIYKLNEQYETNTNNFQELVFIYNAIMNGWKVKQIGNGLFEFEKDLQDIPKKYKCSESGVKDSFLFKFLKNNLSLECKINQ
jgi:hypothetical protein